MRFKQRKTFSLYQTCDLKGNIKPEKININSLTIENKPQWVTMEEEWTSGKIESVFLLRHKVFMAFT